MERVPIANGVVIGRTVLVSMFIPLAVSEKVLTIRLHLDLPARLRAISALDDPACC